MAMIDEGGMLRVMKDEYKANGYIVFLLVTSITPQRRARLAQQRAAAADDADAGLFGD